MPAVRVAGRRRGALLSYIAAARLRRTEKVLLVGTGVDVTGFHHAKREAFG